MKKLMFILAAATGALLLTSCQSTSNSPTPVATSCSTNSYGQYVNQYNQPCNSSAGACTMNAYGQWVSSNGMTCNGNGAYPYNGYGGGSYGTGCQYYSSIYPGTQWAPAVDPTSGGMVCLNLSSYGITPPPTYNYQTPIYITSCPSYDPTCSGQQWAYGGPTYNNYGYYPQSTPTCVGFGYGDMFGGACF
jgi:hypothetical protein